MFAMLLSCCYSIKLVLQSITTRHTHNGFGGNTNSFYVSIFNLRKRIKFICVLTEARGATSGTTPKKATYVNPYIISSIA